MERRVWALALSITSLAAVAGCGDGNGSTEAQLPKNSPALSKRIATLSKGMTVGTVKTTLGEPLDETTVDEAGRTVEMLFYGNWQLLFDDGKLDKRVKYVWERPFPKLSVEEQKERAVNRQILALQRGMPMATVKARLGVPETYEIDGNTPKEEVLSYEIWDLRFSNGVLKHRSQH